MRLTSTHRRVIAVLLPLLLFCGVLALVPWTERAAPVPPLPLPDMAAPAASHAGPEACAACHAAEHRDWLGSHHHRAMARAEQATVRAPFRGETATHRGREARFFRRGDRFFARIEIEDGTPADVEVTHSFGVAPLQQYLVPRPGGRLQPLPWAWDTRPAAEGGQRWFHLYPDEDIPPGDPLHWTARVQTWNLQCASCHATDLRRGFNPAEGYRTTAAAMGVTCEACHGGGARHVAWARGGRDGADDPTKGLSVRFPREGGDGNWVMDPARGIARWEGAPRATAAVEVCADCHARRREITAERNPAEPFLDQSVPALLEAGLYHADGHILDEVFEWGSFVQSRMHQAGVLCTDCHRPHSAKLRAEGNALCLQCHAGARFDTAAHHRHAEGTPGAQCVACHMPSRTFMVVHARRDHGFRVPRPDLSMTLGTPNACNDCHRDRDAAWAAARVTDWHGATRPAHWATAIAAGRAGERGAGAQLLALVADRDAPGIVRATALSLLPGNATPGLAPTLEAAARDADPLVRMAAAAAFAALPPAQRVGPVAPLLGDPLRAVRLEAVRVLALVPDAALSPAQREARQRAMAEYVASIRHNADQPEALTDLAAFQAELGRWTEAEAEYRAALRLDASHVPASLGLADLMRRSGREPAAETALRGGIGRAPGSGELQHALGLSLVRQGRLPEALAALAKAVELEPANPRFAYVQGVALHSTGRSEEASEALRAALGRLQDPGRQQRDILMLLALIARDRGATAVARDYAAQVLAADPEDREARQLLASLAGQP